MAGFGNTAEAAVFRARQTRRRRHRAAARLRRPVRGPDRAERMPVFVAPEAFDLWLDCANVEADVAAALIAPANAGLLEVYEVSTAVNRVVNDSAALIAPVPAGAAQAAASAPAAQEKKIKQPKPSDGQASLF